MREGRGDAGWVEHADIHPTPNPPPSRERKYISHDFEIIAFL